MARSRSRWRASSRASAAFPARSGTVTCLRSALGSGSRVMRMPRAAATSASVPSVGFGRSDAKSRRIVAGSTWIARARSAPPGHRRHRPHRTTAHPGPADIASHVHSARQRRPSDAIPCRHHAAASDRCRLRTSRRDLADDLQDRSRPAARSGHQLVERGDRVAQPHHDLRVADPAHQSLHPRAESGEVDGLTQDAG